MNADYQGRKNHRLVTNVTSPFFANFSSGVILNQYARESLMTETSETHAGPSALAQLGNIFLAPAQALDYAREHPKMWWLPYGITLLLQLILGLWVAATVNIKYIHAMMAHAIMQSNPEHANQAIKMLNEHGRGFMMIGAIGGVIALGVGELLFALYLFLADKTLSAAPRSFGKWFSFTAWTWMPITIAIIIGGIVWGLSSHNGMATDPTSLNALFFHFSPFRQKALYSVAQFSLLEFWIIALVAWGVKRWCNYSTAKSMGIAVLPFIVVYLIKFFL